jgi:hypothetical protein
VSLCVYIRAVIPFRVTVQRGFLAAIGSHGSAPGFEAASSGDGVSHHEPQNARGHPSACMALVRWRSVVGETQIMQCGNTYALLSAIYLVRFIYSSVFIVLRIGFFAPFVPLICTSSPSKETVAETIVKIVFWLSCGILTVFLLLRMLKVR